MSGIRGVGGKDQVAETKKPLELQKTQALTERGAPREVTIGVPGKLRVSKDTVNVEFQPLGKRSIDSSKEAWTQVENCVETIGVSAEEWEDLGTRDQQAEVLIDAIEVTFSEVGLDSEFATVLLQGLSALASALHVAEEEDTELQELNLARAVAIASDIVHDFGEEMDFEQTGLMLQMAANIYTNKSADGGHCQSGAVLLQNIADRCDLAEGSNQRAVLIDMLEKPPSRLKSDPDFLKAHARAISTASAALDGLTETEATSLFKGIDVIASRSTDEGVREACLEALQDLESFVEPQGALLTDIQKLEARLEKLLS